MVLPEFCYPYSLRIRVQLELFGVPVHECNADSVRRIISSLTVLERVSPCTLIDMDLSVFEVFTFRENLDNIPQIVQMTLYIRSL